MNATASVLAGFRRPGPSRNRSLLAIGMVVAGCVVAACAHAGTTSGTDCPLTEEDTIHLQAGPVYRDCAVDRRARLITSSVRINHEPSVRPVPGSTYCHNAEIYLVVDSSGRPELDTVRMVRTNEPSWGQAVLASVRNWRYEPAEKDGAAVRQVVRERRTAALVVAAVRSGQGRQSPPRPDCQ